MGFKQIRNKIRTYSFQSLSIELINILKTLEREEKLSAFWHPLILLKWTFEFAGEKHPPRTATRNDVVKLLNSMESIEMEHELFNLKKHKNPHLIFIIISNQQMFYQETVWWFTFARQLVLYDDSKTKHKYDIGRAFENLTGLTIELFLQLMFATWSYVEQLKLIKYEYSGFLEKGYFELLIALAGKVRAQAFVDLLVLDEMNAKRVIDNESKIRDYNLQIFEVSIFTKKPIVHLFGHSFIPHKSILNQTVNHFIYDFMKQNDPSFTEELGRRMEKYMELGLVSAKIKYEPENEIKKRFGKKSNVVDFILQDEILVEAKAIELKQYTNVNPVTQLLTNELKSSIVKAYGRQLLTVANKLPKKEYFGLIITYKRIYLGSPYDVWDLFLKDSITEIIDELKLDIDKLPPQNLFIMDIETWDKLLQVVKNRGTKIVNILKKARDNNESGQTKKFYFAQHLEDYHIQNFTLEHLTEAYTKFKNFKD